MSNLVSEQCWLYTLLALRVGIASVFLGCVRVFLSVRLCMHWVPQALCLIVFHQPLIQSRYIYIPQMHGIVFLHVNKCRHSGTERESMYAYPVNRMVHSFRNRAHYACARVTFRLVLHTVRSFYGKQKQTTEQKQKSKNKKKIHIDEMKIYTSRHYEGNWATIHFFYSDIFQSNIEWLTEKSCSFQLPPMLLAHICIRYMRLVLFLFCFCSFFFSLSVPLKVYCFWFAFK